MKNSNSSTRLYVIVARSAPVGVIIRRGPSKQVVLIKWNMEDDTFEIGQWLKARVYETRCDLSPEGDMLLYFASDNRRSLSSWSAVSRPPYFTALALWKKSNTFGGGGLFLSRSEIALDRRPWEETGVAEGFSLPEWLTIGRIDRNSWNEYDPFSPWSRRLAREGWKLTDYPSKTKDEFGSKVMIEFDPPVTWQKAHPLLPEDFTLQMSLVGINERNGPWHLIDHIVTGKNGYVGKIGRSDWADWSQTGDLLFSQSGCLYRLGYKKGALGPIEASREIADFSCLEFQQCEAPAEAQEWPSR